MDNLAKLFGSQQKIRLMRLFLMHMDTAFSVDELKTKTKIRVATLKKDLVWLINASVVKKQNRVTKTPRGAKKVTAVYMLNPKCSFKAELYSIVAPKGDTIISTLQSRFKKTGKIDLLVASGFFMHHDDARIDLLIVGKNLKKQKIEATIGSLETEIGKELLYAFFDTQDFLYRAHMYDKLIRDVIDFSHIKVVDTGILSRVPKMS